MPFAPVSWEWRPRCRAQGRVLDCAFAQPGAAGFQPSLWEHCLRSWTRSGRHRRWRQLHAAPIGQKGARQQRRLGRRLQRDTAPGAPRTALRPSCVGHPALRQVYVPWRAQTGGCRSGPAESGRRLHFPWCAPGCSRRTTRWPAASATGPLRMTARGARATRASRCGEHLSRVAAGPDRRPRPPLRVLTLRSGVAAR